MKWIDNKRAILDEIKTYKAQTYLRVGLRIHNFFSFQDNNGKFLLPLSVLSSSWTMNLIHNPKQASQNTLTRTPKNKTDHTHTHTKREKVPENFLNKRTPNGVVSITVPSSSNTLIRSWAWSWHLQKHRA